MPNMQSDNFLKIFYVNSFFLNFPVADYEISGIYFDSSAKESLVFIESFSDNIDQSISIEKKTQDQSNNPEWAICEKIDLLLQRISNGFIHCKEIKQNWKKKFLLVKRRLSKLQQWNVVQNMNQMLLNYILIPTC